MNCIMESAISDHPIRKIAVRQAILLYGENEHSPEFATIHPVDIQAGGQTPVIRAGRPLDKRGLAELATTLFTANRTKPGLLPPNVLSVGNDHLVWWSPPATRPIFFRGSGRDTSKQFNIGERNGITFHPGLIFAVKDAKWYVLAVKGAERPTADTLLYVAPYFNVWENAVICAGNVPLPKAAVTEKIAAWEKAFFESNFTHTNVTRLVQYKGGGHRFWADMLDGKFEAFPEKVLLPFSFQDAARKKGVERTASVGDLIHIIEGPME